MLPMFGNDSDLYSPFRRLWEMQREMDRLFDDVLPRRERVLTESAFQPRCDMTEADSHYLVTLDVPGVSPRDIEIECRDQVVTVSGERRHETESKQNDTGIYRERSFGRFQRSFALPSDADSERVEATYENGVLSLWIPKAESAKPRRIEIKEGGGGVLQRLFKGGTKNSAKEGAATEAA